MGLGPFASPIQWGVEEGCFRLTEYYGGLAIVSTGNRRDTAMGLPDQELLHRTPPRVIDSAQLLSPAELCHSGGACLAFVQ